MPDSTRTNELDTFGTFGDLLRFLRRRAGLTQTELAIAVGYSHAQISRLEQNHRLPDLATLRDRAENRAAKIIYGMLAMGWRGSAAHWHRYATAYLLMAGLATPLVVSVHSVVGMDFAAASSQACSRAP